MLLLILDVLLIMLFILKGVMYISIVITIAISTLIFMSGVSLVSNGVYRMANKSNNY